MSMKKEINDLDFRRPPSLAYTKQGSQPEADPEKNDRVVQSNIRGTYVWGGAPWREAAILPQEEIQGPMALGSL